MLPNLRGIVYDILFCFELKTVFFFLGKNWLIYILTDLHVNPVALF